MWYECATHTIRDEPLAHSHHVHLVYYHMFMSRNSGIICKECIDKKNSELVHTSNNLSKTYGINILKKFIQDDFEIKINDECVSSDIAIKPKNIKEDLYLPIQIKTTEKFNYDCYGFVLNSNKYKDMLLILICLNEEKIWIINDIENINLKGKLNITKKSKYEKYFIKNNSLLNNILLDYYNNLNYNKTYEEINTAITKCVQTEQFYKKLRETNLPFIKFIYDDLKYQVYDFKINNFKIQEKTITKMAKRKYTFILLEKNSKNKKKQPYELGDNDYYWFHCRNNEHFYVISEKILFEYGFIADKQNNIKGNNRLSLKKNIKWLEEYKFSFNNLDSFKNKYPKFLVNEKITKTEYIYIKNDNISSKTFASKKADIHKTFKELPYYKYYDLCIKCNSFMQKSDNNICVKCYNENRIDYDKLPSLEELQFDIMTTNYIQTGKKYKVTDNTIRRWEKKLIKKKEIKKYN